MIEKWMFRRSRRHTYRRRPQPYEAPLDASTREVLEKAEEEAQAFGDPRVSTCHVLQALTGTKSRGVAALETLGVTALTVHGQIEGFYQVPLPDKVFHQEGLDAEGDSTEVEIDGYTLFVSRRTKEVIEDAQRVAYDYGRASTTPFDLLLALTRGRTGSTSDKVLDGLGRPVSFVHSQVIRKRVEPRLYEIERRVRHIDDLVSGRLTEW